MPFEEHAHCRRGVIVVLTALAAIGLIRTAGATETYVYLFPPPTATATWWRLGGMAWWAAIVAAAYAALPAIVIVTLFGHRLRDYHLRPAFHLAPAAALYVCLLPALWWAARQPAFAETYPLYRLAHRSLVDFAAWEGLYMAQFAALEFFYRGFLLAGIGKAIGNPVAAVWIAAAPYAMIHTGKPGIEVIASAGAGIVLGMLALRTGSIWTGAAVHGAAAFTLDCLVLQKETIPT